MKAIWGTLFEDNTHWPELPRQREEAREQMTVLAVRTGEQRRQPFHLLR